MTSKARHNRKANLGLLCDVVRDALGVNLEVNSRWGKTNYLQFDWYPNIQGWCDAWTKKGFWDCGQAGKGRSLSSLHPSSQCWHLQPPLCSEQVSTSNFTFQCMCDITQLLVIVLLHLLLRAMPHPVFAVLLTTSSRIWRWVFMTVTYLLCF